MYQYGIMYVNGYSFICNVYVLYNNKNKNSVYTLYNNQNKNNVCILYNHKNKNNNNSKDSNVKCQEQTINLRTGHGGCMVDGGVLAHLDKQLKCCSPLPGSFAGCNG